MSAVDVWLSKRWVQGRETHIFWKPHANSVKWNTTLKMKTTNTEQVGVVVTFWTCTWEIPG